MESLGFVAEPHGDSWLVSPATRAQGEVKCHDLSGFLGSWVMKEQGKFFLGKSAMCMEAMDLAIEYAAKQKGKV
jgi:hypothetical protein